MAIGWPLSHVLILLVINTGLGRAVPYGDSAALWWATGVIPFQAFQYMSRFIMMGILLNRPQLSFPVVKVTDILFARPIVEVLNAGLAVLILFVIFWSLGIDFMPRDVVQASLAMLAMMLLGLGFCHHCHGDSFLDDGLCALHGHILDIVGYCIRSGCAAGSGSWVAFLPPSMTTFARSMSQGISQGA
jgi:hypothetical protein